MRQRGPLQRNGEAAPPGSLFRWFLAVPKTPESRPAERPRLWQAQTAGLGPDTCCFPGERVAPRGDPSRMLRAPCAGPRAAPGRAGAGGNLQLRGGGRGAASHQVISALHSRARQELALRDRPDPQQALAGCVCVCVVWGITPAPWPP